MAPRQRNKENKPYPTNWRLRKKGNRFYILFRVPETARHLWDDRVEVVLGKGDSPHAAEREAYKAWSDRISINTTPDTMGKGFDRYQAEVIPTKSPASQKSNNYSLKRLRQAIPTDMPIVAFRTHHAYQYRDQCAKLESPKKANLDLEVLSHFFTKCLQWGTPGLIEHPIRGKVGKIELNPRTRYIEDWELEAFLSVASPMLKVYTPLKYALGIDQSMMLRIMLHDIKEDRLLIPKRGKIKKNAKAKPKEYLFFDKEGNDTGLEALLDAVQEWRKKHVKVLSGYLFCTSLGQPYIKEDGTASGFQTAWRRSMDDAIEKTDLKERFTEHDLCAKTASDVETVEQAAKLRGHLNTATTDKIYRRKGDEIVPLMPKKG